MSETVYTKMHERHGSQVLAFADPDLIGCELSNGQIKFHVSAHFYAGTLVSREEALDLLRNFPNTNLLGSLVLSAVEEGIIAEDAILWLEDKERGLRVPHAVIIHV